MRSAKIVIAFSALALGLSACTASVGDLSELSTVSSQPQDDSAADAPETLADKEPQVAFFDRPEHTDSAKALLLANGIVVPVVATLPDFYSIHTPCGLPGTIDADSGATEIAWADIVLDPGHGGEIETGAVGPNGLTEKELNLDVAEATQQLLLDRGFEVVLTRTGDYRMPLSVRAEIANRLRSQVMVSIHHNAPNANPSDEPGTEIFFQDGDSESRRLGGLIYSEVKTALTPFALDWVAATDAGTLAVLNSSGTDAYGMIRRPDMTAVLAELGYLSNAPEAQLMATDGYLAVVSLALADAIESWFVTSDPGSGFSDHARVFDPSGLTGGSDGCVDPDLG